MRNVHHSAICVRDVEASLRFWRDGIGLSVLMDRTFDGNWRELFDAPSNRLRSVFLGDSSQPDAGIVELVSFEGDVDDAPIVTPPAAGFFLLSLFGDVDSALERLAALDLGGTPRRITVPGPRGGVSMATVRDPDGVLVELIDTTKR